MAGSFPPSSRVARLRSGAIAPAIRLPVAIEPVKLTIRGTGCRDIHSPTWSLPLTTFSTPGGRLARDSSPRRRHASGVKGDGLTTIVQPAARPGAIFAMAVPSGKFHGVIAATG